jgi:hypothetical protein
MSAPAQVTEAHRELAYAILFATEDGHAGPNETAQLIADSEAKALCEIAMVAAASADRNVSLRLQNAELRAVFPRILAALVNGACCAPDVSVEFIQSIPNEVARVVAQLRAEVAWWKNWHEENEKLEDGIAIKVQATIAELRAEVRAILKIVNEQTARAELAEAEVERLRGYSDELDGVTNALGDALARAERAEASLHALRLVCGTTDADKFTTWVDRANARAEKAEAELKAEQDNSAINEIELKVSRAIVSKIWVQLGSPTYEQLKGRSIYDLIDELKAELAKERARLDWLSTRGFEHRHHETGDHLGYEWTISSCSEPEDVTLRDAIDAEMREEAK